MGAETTKLILFGANLVFIVTNLYGWLLKRFYVPEAYRENLNELYPAQQSVAFFYLLQLFEIPYLLMVGQPQALFYANGTALLLFTSSMLVMLKSYFFPEAPITRRWLFWLPVGLCWVVLLLPLLKASLLTPMFQRVMTWVVLAVFLGYLFLLNRFRLQLAQRIHEIDEDEYSNEEDFPVKFARSIKWLPLLLVILLAATFLSNNVWVKMVRDVLFSVIDVWFILFTLNPHRKLKQMPETLQKDSAKEDAPVKYHVSEEQRKELETKMMKLLQEEKLYLEAHFTMSDLIQWMSTNKTYLSEVIARSEYGSFYQLVNTLRIEHACQLLSEDSHLKMEQVAFSSGFSSGSAFSQVFKRIKGVSPSEYLREKA